MTVPTGKPRGRPKKADVEARRATEGPGDWVDTHRGVNQSWLVNAFRMDSRTVKTRMARCPVLRTDDKGHPLYDFVEAARYLAKPPPDAIAAFFRGMKVGDLPTFLQDQYWGAMRKRQIWEENAGHLWRTNDVLDTLGDVFSTMKAEIQLWVENIEQRLPLTAEQRAVLLGQIDTLQEGLHSRLVEIPGRRRTPSQIEDADIQTERSPEYAILLDDEDLLG